MIAAACLTLAAVHFPIWCKNRAARASLYFSLTAIAITALVFCELWMLRAQTPEKYATAVRWTHVPVWLVMLSLIGFVRAYLEAGRWWLAWCAIGMRTMALLANFTTGSNLNLLETTAVQRVQFLGEQVSVAVGVPNPWMLLGQLSLWLFVIFVVDASVAAWRRGDRRKAAGFGGSIVFLVLAGAAQAVLVFWQGIEAPLTLSLFYLGIIAVMAYELSRDVWRAQELIVKLGESEQHMSLAADAANLGVWTRDVASNETWVSGRWRELFGFAPSEPLNLEGLLQRVHSDDRDTVRRLLGQAVTGPGRYHIEFRVVLPDGATRWIAAQGRAEFDSRGRAIRTRGAAMDCTARKKAEQEMRLLHQEIAHVGRVSVMGQLATALAHEINQPLGAILRNTEAAALYLEDPSPDLDEVRAILDDIHKDDQRAGAVIDRMRAFLRRQDIEMRPLDVGELFSDVAALLKPDAAARHVKLDLDVPRDVPSVAGDRVHLQQVLLNLVSNGMDAIDESNRNSRRVVLSAKRDGAQSVEIAVSDSGGGIPAEKLGRVFDPFFTTKPKGMGMGLSISRTIIEAHGGWLWAENHIGGGARFLFTVPAAGEGSP
ncbi:sensor histidine kinase [Variovorax sp. DT-64]|uniref:sensor histidine kinase n=1 Tax=Variovorax sp. DT-64 TaxID=3396160 RepID=UPI003F5413B1